MPFFFLPNKRVVPIKNHKKLLFSRLAPRGGWMSVF